jgi:hypothetical protein
MLAVFEFGPLNQWMNGYWGGAVSATAGCLVFGALPRMRESARLRDAALLSLGLALQLLSRPYESLFLVSSVLLFFLPVLRQRDEVRRLARALPVIVLVTLPAIVITLAQNRQVTGGWTTLPYVLSRYQYGVPTRFTTEQRLDYKVQVLVHGDDPETIGTYFARLAQRVRFYRFFFLAPLYLALPMFFVTLREWRFVWVVLTLLLFSLGANFYPYFYPHYIAAVTCFSILVSVRALECLSRRPA